MTKTFIHPSAVIADGVKIEDGVYIGPFCVIGFPPEDKKHFPNAPFSVVIKSGSQLTCRVTVDAGTVQNTIVGENTFLMEGVHVGHDCKVSEDVIISTHSVLGGHVQVLKGANLGLSCIIHPRQIIGAYCMIGSGAVITTIAAIKPFQTYFGNPARKIGENTRGIERNGLSDSDIEYHNQQFESLRTKSDRK